jgi:hypothetical protein
MQSSHGASFVEHSLSDDRELFAEDSFDCFCNFSVFELSSWVTAELEVVDP